MCPALCPIGHSQGINLPPDCCILRNKEDTAGYLVAEEGFERPSRAKVPSRFFFINQ